MTCITSFDFKRGSTFEVELALTDDLGVPVVIDVDDMRSEVRSGNTLLAVLTIATTAVPGTYLLTATEDTSVWPLGVILMDVRAIVGGLTIYSDTVAFRVAMQVTLEEVVIP